MIFEVFGFSFDSSGLILFALVGVLVGMAKTGVQGVGMMAVPILAIIFGGKESSGIMLPILILADMFGVTYYHRHADFSHLVKLLRPTIIGVLLGTYVGSSIDDEQFRLIMGITILGSLILMMWKQSAEGIVTSHWSFAWAVGLAAGFTTMVGNLAGTVMALYLLSMRMPKNQFIGTAAWFFLCINLFKVPFHIWAWQSISVSSFLLDLCLLPAIALGAFLGIRIIKRLPEMAFRYFIIIMTLVAAIFMIV